MSVTISTTITSSVTLYVSPTTITSTGAVLTAAGDAAYGPSGTSWTLINAGEIETQDTVAAGIDIGSGSVVNQQYGDIAGGYGVRITSGLGTVANYGGIGSGSYTGVGIMLDHGGTVLNGLAGQIDASHDGIAIRGGAGTVVDAGYISVPLGTAIQFAAGYSNLLLLQPNGAFFQGNLDGGNTVGSAIASILELSAYNVSQDGTVVPGFGELQAIGDDATKDRIANFASVVFDSSAVWGISVDLNFTGTIAGFAPGDRIDVSAVADAVVLNGSVLTITDQGTLVGQLSMTGVNLAGPNATSAFAVYPTDNEPAHITLNATLRSGSVIGTITYGVTLSADSTTIPSTSAVQGRFGDALSGAYGQYQTVVNYGAIGLYQAQIGVDLDGGAVSNAVSGVISGRYGVWFFGDGTVDNAGSIVGYFGDAVRLSGGGNLDNTGILVGAALFETVSGTIINSGMITATQRYGSAVTLAAGGSVDNGGTILGDGYGIHISGGIGTVVNHGFITASNTALYGDAIALGAGGEIDNTETIAGHRFGIDLPQGGTVSNAAGGVISGVTRGVYIGNLGGTVINAGAIQSTLSAGIKLTHGGTISNAGSGVISSADNRGVYVTGASATVVNAGLLSGGTVGAAIALASGGTINNIGTIRSAAYAIGVQGGPGIVTNAGLIAANVGTSANDGVSLLAGGTATNSGTITANQYGVFLTHGGTVTNAAGGLISGGSRGVYVQNATGTLFNAGTIVSTAKAGVKLTGGGYVSNASTGVVNNTTSDGVYISGASGSVVNDGLLSGPTAGVEFRTQQGTVTNAGTIASTGTSNSPIIFSVGFTNRLIVDPGAVFVGTVSGGNAIGGAQISTLDFAPGTFTGTLSGLGSHYVDFGQISVDPSASWSLSGENTLIAGTTLANSGTLLLASGSVLGADTLVNNGSIVLDPSTMTVAGLAGAGTIQIESASTLDARGTIADGETIMLAGEGAYLHIETPGSIAGGVTNFGFGAAIDLKGIDPATVSYAAGHLQFTGGGFPLAIVGGPLQATASADGAVLSVLCFRSGTHIATELGDVPVEALVIGDRVLVAGNRSHAPIIWIGRRHIDCARHPRPELVWPVRVSAGAFGAGQPWHDLWLSPDHALFVDDMLIPVKYLVNGTTIAQIATHDVTYYHVELPQHAVLLAEGLAAESYLETGDRRNFDNCGGAVAIHPDFASRLWEAEGCAPLVVTGAKLERVRRGVNVLARVHAENTEAKAIPPMSRAPMAAMMWAPPLPARYGKALESSGNDRNSPTLSQRGDENGLEAGPTRPPAPPWR